MQLIRGDGVGQTVDGSIVKSKVLNKLKHVDVVVLM